MSVSQYKFPLSDSGHNLGIFVNYRHFQFAAREIGRKISISHDVPYGWLRKVESIVPVFLEHSQYKAYRPASPTARYSCVESLYYLHKVLYQGPNPEQLHPEMCQTLSLILLSGNLQIDTECDEIHLGIAFQWHNSSYSYFYENFINKYFVMNNHCVTSFRGTESLVGFSDSRS